MRAALCCGVRAQLKGMLDLVERDVLVPAGVSFLRLDGSVDAGQRFGIVQVRVGAPHTTLLVGGCDGLGRGLASCR